MSQSTPPSAGERLRALEQELSTLSHSEDAVQHIRAFVAGLGKLKAKQAFFLPEGVLVRRPIQYAEALAAGLITPEEDPFNLLQGDVIQTDAAYFMGEQISGLPKFIIANSTCDLVVNRRQYAALLRVHPLRSTQPNWQNQLGALLTFESTQHLYLPPLPGDEEDVVANVVHFDGLAQIALDDLQLAIRKASLSLVGWRIFGSMLRGILVRTGESEIQMRRGL